ncbi:MAG: AMP-binding protein [Flavobacteriaceae bacterium]|nr:AMP-binding protein [Flavobacteriaceae bacterium]
MTQFKSPLEAFLYWEKATPEDIFLRQPIDGKLVDFTFKQSGEEARKIAGALLEYGLSKQSHVALLSKNCAHWIIADLAIMMAGCITIPIYPTLNAKSVNKLLEHSESKAIVIGKLDDFESQKAGIIDIPVISVDFYGENYGDLWSELIKKHTPLQKLPQQHEDDLITIIYTSGTTGSPKGVMHTVGNFMRSSYALIDEYPIPKRPKLFSYLPLAHVAERVGITVLGLILGARISFAESLDTFATNLADTQPHIFFAVPRIWTKFQEKILENIPQKRLNMLLSIPVLNTLFKKKLKQKLGLKDAKLIVSAAAPLAVSSMKWYNQLDIKILQLYGMTEDCVISHGNHPTNNKIGTVGKAHASVSAKLSAEGEILIKNSCLMKGYFKEPELTANSFTDDGYLKTGDIGEYDHDGFLTITGRVKDQFKTDKGKYISPAPIELEMEKNTDIEQICIVGTGIPQPIALITLSESGKAKSKSELSNSLTDTVNLINPLFEKHEKLEKVVIMKEDWTVDNGLTTPTLKIKRNAIEKIHRPYYKQWFEMQEKVIFE